MLESSSVTKCITIKKEQEEFLINEAKFKLSKFVQYKLAEWIKFKKEYDEFMAREDEDEETI